MILAHVNNTKQVPVTIMTNKLAVINQKRTQHKTNDPKVFKLGVGLGSISALFTLMTVTPMLG